MFKREYLFFLFLLVFSSVFYFQSRTNNSKTTNIPKLKQRQVYIYVKAHCPYCIMAKQLFYLKNINFIEIDIEKFPEEKTTMISRAKGATTVPQIFIDKYHIGGFDNLQELEDKKELDSLLWE